MSEKTIELAIEVGTNPDGSLDCERFVWHGFQISCHFTEEGKPSFVVVSSLLNSNPDKQDVFLDFQGKAMLAGAFDDSEADDVTANEVSALRRLKRAVATINSIE